MITKNSLVFSSLGCNSMIYIRRINRSLWFSNGADLILSQTFFEIIPIFEIAISRIELTSTCCFDVSVSPSSVCSIVDWFSMNNRSWWRPNMKFSTLKCSYLWPWNGLIHFCKASMVFIDVCISTGSVVIIMFHVTSSDGVHCSWLWPVFFLLPRECSWSWLINCSLLAL